MKWTQKNSKQLALWLSQNSLDRWANFGQDGRGNVLAAINFAKTGDVGDGRPKAINPLISSWLGQVCDELRPDLLDSERFKVLLPLACEVPADKKTQQRIFVALLDRFWELTGSFTGLAHSEGIGHRWDKMCRQRDHKAVINVFTAINSPTQDHRLGVVVEWMLWLTAHEINPRQKLRPRVLADMTRNRCSHTFVTSLAKMYVELSALSEGFPSGGRQFGEKHVGFLYELIAVGNQAKR